MSWSTRYVGDTFLADGVEVTITAVGEYEPPDPSVGITGGQLEISGSDGREYLVFDDGAVYALEDVHDSSSKPVAHVAPLYDPHDWD